MTDAESEARRATECYAGGGSPTVSAFLGKFGAWMPEDAARRVVDEHYGDQDEILGEVLWGGPVDATGGSTLVHVAHLFFVLGY